MINFQFFAMSQESQAARIRAILFTNHEGNWTRQGSIRTGRLR
jgi:hypothetical protein